MIQKEQGLRTGDCFLPELPLPKPQCPLRFDADITIAIAEDRGLSATFFPRRPLPDHGSAHD